MNVHTRAPEILEMAQELEHLAKNTPTWYACTRARVGVKAALEQEEELSRVLEELGMWIGK